MENQDNHGTFGKWIIRLGAVLLAGVWLALIATTWAEAADGGYSSDSSSSDDEYNFNWLDPDKKIYVLQNRRYTKADHVMVSAMLGPTFSVANPYRTSFGFGGKFGYFFSESWGAEVFYTGFTNSPNSTYEALTIGSGNVIPKIREIRGEMGAMVNWVPWYAKINVFNKILYFDWYFSAGPGTVHTALDTRTNSTNQPSYVMQDFFGFYLGTGHIYHLSQNFSVRLDFLGAFYSAPKFGDTGDNTWFSNYSFSAGIGYHI